MIRLLSRFGFAALAVFIAGAALAAPPSSSMPSRPAASLDRDQRTQLEKINGYFNSITNLSGKFVQVGPDGNKTEGDFYMLKPGKVRFEYDEPSPIELISDGDAFAFRDRKLATQDIYPLSQTPLRFLLSDRLDLLKVTNFIDV